MTKKNIELRARQESNIDNNDLDNGRDSEGNLLTLKNDKIKELNDVNELYSMEDSFSNTG